MDEIELFFAGTGGSVPAARRGLSALLVRLDGDRLLFDCGEGTQRQLIRSVGLADVDAVFLTHHHADHWLGLPGMLKTFDLRGREKPLDVFGPPGTERLLGSISGVWGRLGYALRVTDLAAGDAIEFGGYEVEAFNVRHRVSAFGYLICEDERPGRFDAARATALGVKPGPDFGRIQAGETVDGVRPADVVDDPRPGRRIVISGDTAPCDTVRELARGADVLVHEATFLDEDSGRAGETEHSTARQAAEVAAEAQPRLLVLTHLSSRYPPRLVREEAQGVFERVHVARDFDAVVVPHAEKGAPRAVPWERADRVPRGGLDDESAEFL
jgi:ribonuclease Z